MTIVKCPHGCGGVVNTATEITCPSCRRGLNETEWILPEDAQKVETEWGLKYPNANPTMRKLSWCWEWFGSENHRMRCRMQKGHAGNHDTHEENEGFNGVSVSTLGELVSGGRDGKG